MNDANMLRIIRKLAENTANVFFMPIGGDFHAYLTGAELRFLRKEIGLSQNRLAELIGSTEQTVSLWERKGRMPKGYDRLIRLIYLESLDGNVKVQEMIERLVDLDSHPEEKLVFEDTATGWKMAA